MIPIDIRYQLRTMLVDVTLSYREEETDCKCVSIQLMR